jgi:hypothetical protein
MFLSSPFPIAMKQLTHPPSPPNQDPKTYIFLSDWQVVGSRSQYLVCLVLTCLGKATFSSSTTTTATVPLSPQLANLFLPLLETMVVTIVYYLQVSPRNCWCDVVIKWCVVRTTPHVVQNPQGNMYVMDKLVASGPPRTGSGRGERNFRVLQAMADRIKIFTLNPKDWLSVADWLGLGLKGLICTIDK